MTKPEKKRHTMMVLKYANQMLLRMMLNMAIICGREK
jgi:hypothetical protein